MDQFIGKIIHLFGKILHINITEELQQKLTQFFKFCLVGVTNTAVHLAVKFIMLAVVHKLFPDFEFAYVPANAVAFVVSVYWSFIWNSRTVFHLDTSDKSVRRKALVKSYLCYGLTSVLLNSLLDTLWIKGLGIDEHISSLMNLVVTIPVNYLTNKKFAFSAVRKQKG